MAVPSIFGSATISKAPSESLIDLYLKKLFKAKVNKINNYTFVDAGYLQTQVKRSKNISLVQLRVQE